MLQPESSRVEGVAVLADQHTRLRSYLAHPSVVTKLADLNADVTGEVATLPRSVGAGWGRRDPDDGELGDRHRRG
jgi:hypothetical protein